jgi:AcrR family transcriptional regulator
VTTTPPGPRRSQAERRAGTRELLLQATIGCLVNLGYAGTTTSEVQQRAGVSRGALTHHFSSKAELLVAAMDSLYVDVNADLQAVADGLLPDPEMGLRPAILILWNRFDGPLFFATLELRGAARTDPALRAALLPHEFRLDQELHQLAMLLIGRHLPVRHRPGHPSAEAICQVLTTSMHGQAMSYAVRPDAPREGPHLQQWFDLVEAFA